MGFFSPKDKSYLPYYKQLGELVVDSAKLLREMALSDVSSYENFSRQITQIEEAGDSVKSQISAWTRKTFVTPYDRDDMYRLASCVDDIIDNYYHVIDTIFMYKIDDLPKKVAKQVEILESLSVHVFAIVSGLSDITVHLDDLEQINKRVNEFRKVKRSYMAKIFSETKSNPIDLIKNKGLVDALDDLADAYSNVASTAFAIDIKGA